MEKITTKEFFVNHGRLFTICKSCLGPCKSNGPGCRIVQLGQVTHVQEATLRHKKTTLNFGRYGVVVLYFI